ncbi:S-adenosylmethionine-dependent methyltransferase [Dispira parvispora]|uniref:S-adenosylmethionine-dependent methyltransferase n=1 Tax=Dispira parvispora TaxID=1520584 RepID=A0A9W8E900_9FUNG|nr:S-adenosylmethionine-dependent methyltransferase [Dispira parvispora]
MPSFPTPSLSHFKSADYHRFYEPAEDSFLLLDALESDYDYLQNHVRPTICLEVGSGSGIVTTFLATQVLAQQRRTEYFVTDLNWAALEATQQTCVQNGLDSSRLHPIRTDLVQGLLPRLRHQIDILVFNPPYAVTSSDECGTTTALTASWAGGIDGREVIDRFLPQIPQLLSSKGVCYLVTIEQNRPQEIMQWMWQGFRLYSAVAAKRKAGIELLYILKFSPSPFP